jgi:glycerate dehydrogenase
LTPDFHRRVQLVQATFLDFRTVSHNDIDPAPLEATGVELKMFDVTSDDELEARLGPAQILITNKIRLDKQRLALAPGLELICLAATGTDNVDLEVARRRGIGVCNIVGYCTQSVVQHVFAVILALTHHLDGYGKLLHRGAWRDSPQFCLLDFPIRELSGRTLGIIGLGQLGSAVATIGRAFGMRVLAARRTDAQLQEDDRVPLEELLRQSDVISLHCPLTAENRGLIGAGELEMMKPDALLINTARGGLVDSAALADALRAGRIGGAAVDVLPQEPPVDGDPLLAEDIPNLIVTPHIAWAAREARQRAVNEIAANIDSYLSGGRRCRIV